jgi:hypothetical protein
MKELAIHAAMLAACIFPLTATIAYLAARFGLIKGIEWRVRNSPADPK